MKIQSSSFYGLGSQQLWMNKYYQLAATNADGENEIQSYFCAPLKNNFLVSLPAHLRCFAVDGEGDLVVMCVSAAWRIFNF